MTASEENEAEIQLRDWVVDRQTGSDQNNVG